MALDTSIFIYHLEANSTYVSLTDQIFSWLDSSGSTAATSVITITELLVKPYRESDDEIAQRCYAFLSSYPNLDWIAPTLQIADLAARLRAAHRLRTPDALQAATAIDAHATAFITNDPAFRRIAAFQVIVLDDFVAGGR